MSVRCFGKGWTQEVQISLKVPAPILAACYFLLLWRTNPSLYFSAMWYHFCSFTHPLMQCITCTWIWSVMAEMESPSHWVCSNMRKEPLSSDMTAWETGVVVISALYEPAGLCRAQNLCICGTVITLFMRGWWWAVQFPVQSEHSQRELGSCLWFPAVKEVASVLLSCFLHFPSLVFLVCREVHSDFCVCAELEALEGWAYQSSKEAGSARAPLYRERSRRCFYCSIRTK